MTRDGLSGTLSEVIRVILGGHTLDRGRLRGIFGREHRAIRTRHHLGIIRLVLVRLCIPVWSRGRKLVVIGR